jgi:hypothetical protein
MRSQAAASEVEVLRLVDRVELIFECKFDERDEELFIVGGRILELCLDDDDEY